MQRIFGTIDSVYTFLVYQDLQFVINYQICNSFTFRNYLNLSFIFNGILSVGFDDANGNANKVLIRKTQAGLVFFRFDKVIKME